MTNYHKFQIYLKYETPLLEFKSTLASLSKLDHDDCTCFISYSCISINKEDKVRRYAKYAIMS